MKKFLLGMIITLVAVAGIGYKMIGDNIKIERVEQDHNRTVIVDGVVCEDSNWTEVLGYNVTIDIADGTYIGK